MIHSGSRNLGSKVADHYDKLAQELNTKWFSQILKEWQLAFFPDDSNEAIIYINEMNYCLDFAFRNRQYMMNIIIKILNELNLTNKTVFDMINIHHNYVIKEHHYNQNVWVHRKGATLARKDTIGLIPGSQGTKSYIVIGNENPESFNSCSHGAGRALGRKAAVKQLNLIEEQKKLEDKGIIHAIRNQDDLEEAVGAYKDIDIVMENQKDLVNILTDLYPIAVIKG